LKVGILALQGNFLKHAELCARLDLNPVEIRYPRQLEEVEGLILPGGESTTMSKLMKQQGFFSAIQGFGKSFPILGTCAGLILMAKEVQDERIHCLGLLNITASRNAFGRQIHSFVDQVTVTTANQESKISATFIRAPRILSVGKGVEILSTYQGEAVAVKQGRHLALSFHPELNGEPLFHELVFKARQRVKALEKQQSYAA
jgi:5'-phosphate synthase pdxT subunit